MVVRRVGVRVVGEYLEVGRDKILMCLLYVGSNAPLCEAVSGTNEKARTGSKIAAEKSKRKKKKP